MKLIKTPEYLLLVSSNNKMKKGDYLLEKESIINIFPDYLTDLDECDKILGYRKLNENAKELDLPELPNPFEVDIEKLALEKYQYISTNPPYTTITPKDKIAGFIEGYKAAQQSKQFSLEDMQKAVEMARAIVDSDNKFHTEEEIIQSISAGKMPKEFIPETEINYASQEKVDQGFIYEEEMKLIVNKSGKKELAGTYKY